MQLRASREPAQLSRPRGCQEEAQGPRGVGKYWGQHPGRKQRPRGLMGASCWPCCLARYINPTLITKFVMLLPRNPRPAVGRAEAVRIAQEEAQGPRRCWLVSPDGRAARAAAVSIQEPARLVVLLVGSWRMEEPRPWLVLPDRRAARAAAVSIQGTRPAGSMDGREQPAWSIQEPAQLSPLVV